MNNIDLKRLNEVKAAAVAIAPQADAAEMAAALLVIVFNEKLRTHLRDTQPKLWDQILHAIGPVVPPSASSINSASL